MRGIYRGIIFILLLTLPLISNQFDLRINYILYIFAFLLLPVYLKNLPSLSQKLKKDWVMLFFVLFLASATISTIFSLDKKQSLLQLTLFFSSFIIFLIVKSIFRDFKSKQAVSLVIILAILLPSLISVYNTFFLHIVRREPTGLGFLWVYFGHNHLSALLIFAVPLTIYFLKIYWNQKILRLFLLFALCFLLFAFYLTFARASIISLLLSVFISIFFFRLLSRRKLLIFMLLSIFIVFVALGRSIISAGELGVSKYGVTSKTRVVYWQQAIDNFIQHPIFGSGLDTFRIANRESKRQVKPTTYYTHNFFLQMLSDAGILGFLSGFGLILSVLINAAIKVQKTTAKNEKLFFALLFTGMLASTFNSLVDFDWQLPTVFLFFWIAAGLF